MAGPAGHVAGRLPEIIKGKYIILTLPHPLQDQGGEPAGCRVKYPSLMSVARIFLVESLRTTFTLQLFFMTPFVDGTGHR